ncbi:MAG: multiple sugar transport system substrate-binding protein [Frankiales bacterium]|nr:multiple sugar transport system substrate-binding protein [Frankiales bacterium]
MTRIRKSATLVLAGASCLSLVAACGSSSGSSATSTSSAPTTSSAPATSAAAATSAATSAPAPAASASGSAPSVAPSSAAALAPASITVAIDSGLQPDAKKAIDTQITQFEAKYPTIKAKTVEYTWTGTTFAAKLAGGTLPTVFTVPFTDGRGLIARKQVADVSAEIAKLPYGAKFNPSVAVEGEDASGKLEAVPISAYGQALHYNRDLFTKAGLDPNKPPTTWDELRADAKAISDKTGMAGYAVMTQSNTGGWILTTEAYAMGGRMETMNGTKATAAVNNPQTKQVLKLLHDMRWTDKSMGSNFIYDWNGINQAFAAGKIGMYITGGGTYTNLVTQNKIDPKTYGEGVIPLSGTNSGALGGGTVAMVSVKASAAQQAAAVKWIDFYYMAKLTTQAGAALDAKTNADNKQPVGAPQLPVFDKATYDEQQGWIKQWVNVPLAQMKPYTDAAAAQPLIPEPGVATQDLYAALDPVVQAVLTNKNANVDSLLSAANQKAQTAIGKAS